MAFYIFPDGSALELDHHVPADGREVSRGEYQAARKAAAKEELRKLLPPGSTVYCTLKHVSSSGMLRVIAFLVPVSGIGESVGGTPSDKLRVGHTAYFWNEEQPDKGIATTEGKITHAPRGRNVVTLRLADGTSVVKLRSQLTSRDRRPYTIIRNISHLMAEAAGFRFDDKAQGLRMGGCGMDMGFSAVYGLGASLWPQGTPKPHGRRNGQPDSDGGYALNHQWV